MVKFCTVIEHARPAKEDSANIYIVALLFQIIEYNQIDLTGIPDDLTCTQVLQQWHVPRKDEYDEAILHEDIKFVKISYDKDTGNKKRKTCNPTNSKVKTRTPQFAREIKPDDVKKLAASLNKSQSSYLSKLLESNNFQPHPHEEIHNRLPSKIRCVEMKQDACNIYDCKVLDEMLKQLPQSKPMTKEKIFEIEKKH